MEIIQIIVTALIGSIGGALSTILIARYSKDKRERDAGIATEYLKLVDMSQDQLEKQINMIAPMNARLLDTEEKLRTQERENEQLEQMREERDERIEALEAHTAALEKQKEKDKREITELRRKYEADLEETQRLRNGYALIQKDNIRLYEVTIGLTQTVEKIKKAVQEAGIALELNGELEHLLESVYRLKAEREQRGKE